MKSCAHWYEIWQDDMIVASGEGTDLNAVRKDMLHYALQYLLDGPIEIKGSQELAPEQS